jgi:hypothetical protein
MKTPSGGYRSDFFTASDITASGLKYDLVFMNTCESTDQRYDAIGAFPQRIIRWDGPYYYTDGTKVLDIGRKLNAKNYIGWDCSVVRALSVKIPAMLMEELDTRGSRPEDRRTVVDAVKAVQKRLIDKKPDFWYYWERFTLVDKDGSVILDLNKRKY